MTVQDDELEALAQTIAAQGRDALVQRLHAAYGLAAEAQSDLVQLDEAQIDRLVEHAAEHADGLQWRRALASVAASELGIDFVAALAHPSVARAQDLLEAPSYGQALARLTAGTGTTRAPFDRREVRRAEPLEPEPSIERVAEPEIEPEPVDTVAPEAAPVPEVAPEAAPEPPIEVQPEPEPEPELEPQVGVEPELEPEPEPAVEAVEREQPEDEFEPWLEPGPEADATLQIVGLHINGVADLTERAAVTLLFSDPGLDVLDEDGGIIGRLEWSDVTTVEIPEARRRRRRQHPRLVVHTVTGDAEFEIAGMPHDELQRQLEPVLAAVLSGQPATAGVAEAPTTERVPEPEAVPAAGREPEFEPEPEPQPEPEPEPEPEFVLEPEPEPEPVVEPGPEPAPETEPMPEPEAGEVRLRGGHVAGVANLPPQAQVGISLSDRGLDLLDDAGEIIGRLEWADIDSLEVSGGRGRRRRKSDPQLIVHTDTGDAVFEMRGVDAEKLREQIAPVILRHGVG